MGIFSRTAGGLKSEIPSNPVLWGLKARILHDLEDQQAPSPWVWGTLPPACQATQCSVPTGFGATLHRLKPQRIPYAPASLVTDSGHSRALALGD
ncbi:hypothetical protein SUVZ_11G2590 [Saccharomyces uvarum]|uniref:Uncharacterized protein n=1 Tax=Saccharomyces uvarum TaxID=230603 RepID=A0ABN8WG56_SACUV|nr:hypothetical protein SUVZ_11G2590 [Saccharomyces uvarum]